MNFYRQSIRHNPENWDMTLFLLSCDCPRTKQQNRVLAIHWLSWWRLFYRSNDEDARKRNIKWFLDEINLICNY